MLDVLKSKMLNAPSIAMREKYEQEMKKEIKKL